MRSRPNLLVTAAFCLLLGLAAWRALWWASPIATVFLAALVVVGVPVWAVYEHRRPLPAPPVQYDWATEPPLAGQAIPAPCANPDCDYCRVVGS